MATYEMDEGQLVIPEGWEDRTLNTLEYPGEDDLKVVVSRTPHQGKKLAARVDDVLVDMRRRLAGFELVEQRTTEVDGEPAVAVVVRFKDGPRTLEQRSLWFHAGTKCVTVGVVANTTRDAEAVSAEIARIFEQVERTVALRDAEDATVPAAPPMQPPNL